MWVIVYHTPAPPDGAVSLLYRWKPASSDANPSTPETFVNRRMAVPRPPRAAFRYLYLNRYDVSFANPSTPQSFVNRRMAVPKPPGTIFRYLYRPAHDTSVANPSTPLSWTPPEIRPSRPPRAAFFNLYFSETGGDAPAVAAEDEIPAPWRAQEVRSPYRSRPWLYFGGDSTEPAEEPSDATGFLWVPYYTPVAPHSALALLYQWSSGGDAAAEEVVADTTPIWRPRALVRPDHARPGVYFSGDTSQDNDEGGPLPWRLRPLARPARPPRPGFYFSGDTNAAPTIEAETSLPWRARPLARPARPPQAGFYFSGDTSQSEPFVIQEAPYIVWRAVRIQHARYQQSFGLYFGADSNGESEIIVPPTVTVAYYQPTHRPRRR